MSRMFHVSSANNRASIRAHGLDWSRMSLASGIAGSCEPEADGIFVVPDYFTAEFFVRMNNTGGPVDVWAIDGVDEADLVETGTGFSYLPYLIDPARLTLLDQTPLTPAQVVRPGEGAAYRSSLSIALDDGTVLENDAAHELLARERVVREGGDQ
ncbi:hypothetical protein [Nakamurella antarctica]|uniref:hypothetical protein n=1 Tax=Nakamurella antarctica TaxID=1902245 RepID=UPI0019CF626C|nr:hypothetical protein [Nakamurella antarctica]